MKRLRKLFLVPLCFVGALSGAQEGGDLQAQILYAYYAEDSNGLANIAQLLDTRLQSGGKDRALFYHLAHAEYRQGLLAEARHGGAAAFSACIDRLKPILEEAADSVEALALQSACYAHLARAKKLEAVLLRSAAEDRMSRAAKLEPNNPRVEMLEAGEALLRAKPDSPQAAQAETELERAAQSFDASSATRVDQPSWGHAETYLALGRLRQAHGDFLGARNWLEKSLIIAPDYKAAQRQLAALERS